MKKLIITAIFIISAILLNAQGFTTFIKPSDEAKSYQEIFNSLTGKQKLEYLDAYAQGTKYTFVHDSIANVPEWFVKGLWEYWNNIRDDAYTLMQGKYVTKEAVYNNGSLVTQAQYAKVPEDAIKFLDVMYAKYDEMTKQELTVFLETMVKRSAINKHGKYVGTWSKFKNALGNE